MESAKMGSWDYLIDESKLIFDEAKESLYGMTKGEFDGSLDAWFKYIHPEELERVVKNVQDAIAKGDRYDDDYRVITKQNELKYISTRGVFFKNEDGSVNRGTGLSWDVTDIKNAEIELAKAKEIAEAATLSKSQFLATMSHEIRTPMNAIIGLSNLALKTELNSKQRDYLEKVDRSEFSLLGIINDILDFSKIEAGKLNIEHIPFDLEQVFDNIANLNAGKAQDKGLEYSIHIAKEVPFYLIGDPLRIGQIITNYCSNAIKFTEKGEVYVNVELGEKISDGKLKINFSVRDTGIGLSEEQQSRMFKEFSQADASTTRKHGGTGLGLAISKRLAEMMGGSTWLESEQGKGSTFYFSGVFEVQEQNKRAEFKSPDDLHKLKVLACDDNASARFIIKEAIQTFGYNITTVKSGEDCIKELQQNKYDLLLIDWLMPGMDGMETVKRIKSVLSLSDLPIIMISAFGNEEAVGKAKKLGIKHLISKPYSYSTLFDTIMELFGKDIRVSRSRIERGKKHEAALQKISGASILLAEDNEINQQVASELLEDEGFIVEIANNGLEAVEKVKASGVPSKYALVFMDLQMPVMDGFTATAEIRSLGNYDQLPIISMTADAMSGVKEKCLEMGMNDMVTKPIDPDEVFGVMVEWIKPSEQCAVGNKNLESSIQKSASSIQHPVSTELEISNIPGLNIESALARMNNKKKLYLSVLEKFYTNNQKFCDEMRELVEENDFETAKRVAHTFKGVTGSIGADSLHAMSKSVEETIMDQNTDRFEKEMQSLEKELKKLLAIINSKLDFGSKSETSELNMDLVNELMPKLKHLLEAKSPKAKTLIKELEEAGFENKYFNGLKKAVSKYDFKGALKSLDEIKLKG